MVGVFCCALPLRSAAYHNADGADGVVIQSDITPVEKYYSLFYNSLVTGGVTRIQDSDKLKHEGCHYFTALTLKGAAVILWVNNLEMLKYARWRLSMQQKIHTSADNLSPSDDRPSSPQELQRATMDYHTATDRALAAMTLAQRMDGIRTDSATGPVILTRSGTDFTVHTCESIESKLPKGIGR
jgi:hypothetical protein